MDENVQNESKGKQTGSESEPVFRTKMATTSTLRAGLDRRLSQLRPKPVERVILEGKNVLHSTCVHWNQKCKHCKELS